MRKDPRADIPARQIFTRGKVQKACFMGGLKVKGVVRLETGLESTGAVAAEIDPRIIWWRPQPFTVDLRSGEVAATKEALFKRFADTRYTPEPYTPDLQLGLSSGGEVIVECRHRFWIAKNPDKILRCLTVMPQLGFRYVLLTDADLPHPLARNVRLLRPYLASSITMLPRLLAAARAPRSVQELEHEHGLSRSDILAAIAQGHLSCNLKLRRIKNDTRLQAAEGDSSYLKVLNI